MCKTWFLQNCKGDSGRKESWREQPCPVLQVFSSPSLLLFLPHPSDLDMEECAPYLVSWGKRSSSGTLTCFLSPPTALFLVLCRFNSKRKLHCSTGVLFPCVCTGGIASAVVSCFWMFAETCSFHLRERKKEGGKKKKKKHREQLSSSLCVC